MKAWLSVPGAQEARAVCALDNQSWVRSLRAVSEASRILAATTDGDEAFLCRPVSWLSPEASAALAANLGAFVADGLEV